MTTPALDARPVTPADGRHPMTPVPYRVRSRRPDRADTVTLTLEPVAGAAPPFLPGQFTMIYAPGVGEIPVSISGRARSGSSTCSRCSMPMRAMNSRCRCGPTSIAICAAPRLEE